MSRSSSVFRLGAGFVEFLLKDEQFQKIAGRVLATSNKLMTGMQQLQHAAKWAFVGMVAQAGLGLHAWTEQEDALIKLNALARLHGSINGVNVKHVEELAAKYQSVTRFADEVTEGAVATLTAFKRINESNFDRVLKAGMDLAALSGGDLRQSLMMLGRALEMPARGMMMLRRQNIVLTAAEREQIKAAEAQGNAAKATELLLAAVEKRVHGMAETMGDTTLGKIVRMKNALSDMFETIGSAIAPAVSMYSDAMARLWRWLTPVIEAHQSLTKHVIGLTLGVSGLLIVLPRLIAMFTALKVIWLAIDTIAISKFLIAWHAELLMVAVILGAIAYTLGAIEHKNRSIMENMQRGFEKMYEAGKAFLEKLLGIKKALEEPPKQQQRQSQFALAGAAIGRAVDMPLQRIRWKLENPDTPFNKWMQSFRGEEKKPFAARVSSLTDIARGMQESALSVENDPAKETAKNTKETATSMKDMLKLAGRLAEMGAVGALAGVLAG